MHKVPGINIERQPNGDISRVMLSTKLAYVQNIPMTSQAEHMQLRYRNIMGQMEPSNVRQGARYLEGGTVYVNVVREGAKRMELNVERKILNVISST